MAPKLRALVIISGPEAVYPAAASGLNISMTLSKTCHESGERCVELIFHVVNLIGFTGSSVAYPCGMRSLGRLEFPVGRWAITIDQVAEHDALQKELRLEGGYAFTHTGRITLKTGKQFKAADAIAVLMAFRAFLSFCCGRTIALALAVGRDSRGRVVYESWASPLVQPRTGVHSWFPVHNPAKIGLLFQTFYRLWNDEKRDDVLLSAVHWYNAANSNVALVDGSAVFSQIALESLAWTSLVMRDKILSQEGFGKLSAADNLRLLLAQSGIPTSIPDTLPMLQHYCKTAKGFQCRDIPDATVKIRNDIVHPVKRGVPGEVLREGWSASLWCLELVMLRLLGYDGEYANRLSADHSGLEMVPWVLKDGKG